MKPLAQIAYESYCEHQHWTSFRNEPLPPWEGTRQDIKEAWEASIDGVLDAIVDRLPRLNLPPLPPRQGGS